MRMFMVFFNRFSIIIYIYQLTKLYSILNKNMAIFICRIKFMYKYLNYYYSNIYAPRFVDHNSIYSTHNYIQF